MTIHEAMNKVQTAVDRIPDIRRQVAEELSPDIVEANREQLMKGLDADDNPISPAYSPYTRHVKASKGLPTDKVTLFDTGAFHEGIFSEVQGDEIIIDSKDPKSDGLKERYGERIFGIGSEATESLRELSARKIVKVIREITGF